MKRATPLQDLLDELLVASARHGLYHATNALLRHGADPRNERALVEAASRKHVAIVELLLTAAPPPDPLITRH